MHRKSCEREPGRQSKAEIKRRNVEGTRCCNNGSKWTERKRKRGDVGKTAVWTKKALTRNNNEATTQKRQWEFSIESCAAFKTQIKMSLNNR